MNCRSVHSIRRRIVLVTTMAFASFGWLAPAFSEAGDPQTGNLLSASEGSPGAGIQQAGEVVEITDDGAPGPSPAYEFTLVPRPLPTGRNSRLQIDVTNTSGQTITETHVTLTLPPGFTLTDGDNPRRIPSILPNNTSRIAWGISTPCNLDTAAATFSAEGDVNTGSVSGNGSVMMTPVVEPLALEVFTLFNFLERTFSFEVEADRWSVVSLEPRGGTRPDLWADDDMCMGSTYQTSTGFSEDREVILANGAFYGDATHYALAAPNPGGLLTGFIAYNMEYERASDVTLGTSETVFFDSDERMEARQFPVQAGLFYSVSARWTSTIGQADLILSGYHADRDDADRANADFTVDVTHNRGDESFIFESPATGNFALVMMQDDAVGNAATYALSIVEAFFADGFESGDTTAWSSTSP